MVSMIELHLYGDIEMKKLIASIMLSAVLITSGVVLNHHSLVGTAYANDGGGE